MFKKLVLLLTGASILALVIGIGVWNSRAGQDGLLEHTVAAAMKRPPVWTTATRSLSFGPAASKRTVRENLFEGPSQGHNIYEGWHAFRASSRK